VVIAQRKKKKFVPYLGKGGGGKKKKRAKDLLSSLKTKPTAVRLEGGGPCADWGCLLNGGQKGVGGALEGENILSKRKEGEQGPLSAEEKKKKKRGSQYQGLSEEVT